MPIGANIFYISIVNQEGQEFKEQKSFLVEEPKPKIDLSVIGNNIKIMVTSKVKLSEIMYQWNSEEEKQINMSTYKDKTKFEKEIEIPLGQNTLKIVATDVNGSKQEKVQEIKGVTKATTTTEVKDGYMHFNVTGKENIKTVHFEFNGRSYLMNTDTFGVTKTVHYKVKLVEGNNYLTIRSTTESGGIDTTTWEHKYTTE